MEGVQQGPVLVGTFFTTWTDDQLRKTIQPIVDKCPCTEAVPRTYGPSPGGL